MKLVEPSGNQQGQRELQKCLGAMQHIRTSAGEMSETSSTVGRRLVGLESLKIRQAESSAQIEAIRELFLEYGQSLSFSLCFQSFDKELAGLPGDYAPPEGRLLLATHLDVLVGCVGLHKLEVGICEMKRLYVRPQFRGKGVGKVLAQRVIAEARQVGYKQLRLDTVESEMHTAVAMYRNLGFREIKPYRANPIESALYMELEL